MTDVSTFAATRHDGQCDCGCGVTLTGRCFVVDTDDGACLLLAADCVDADRMTAPRYISTHNGTRRQRDWQSRAEISAESLETLRSWLTGNDPNGDYKDWWCFVLNHEDAVSMVADQSDF